VRLRGGTHNPMAPPFDFLERVFLPVLRRMGADVQLGLERHGFFPAGGGQVSASITEIKSVKDIIEEMVS